MEKVKIGIIGLGGRGHSLLKHCLINMDDVDITFLCDLYEDRLERANKLLLDKDGQSAEMTADYREVLSSSKVDAVLIATSWETHIEISCAAMRAGKAVAMEVGGAGSLQECFDLVKTYEETKTPFMFLENCCYGRYEMLIQNMVEKGVFGEIVACEGGYLHDLREEIVFGRENRHYRFEEYRTKNCHNYPTHDLGPISKILNINNGNRLVSLVSVASGSKGLDEFVRNNDKADKTLLEKGFAQADVFKTIITCADGQIITLTLLTSLPHPYSRGFSVYGTEAMYTENGNILYEGRKFGTKHVPVKDIFGNADEYLEEYEHPVWKKYIAEGVKRGHDGIDWLVIRDFVECFKSNKPMPIDVYDAATWMSISPLSALSIKNGGAVKIPNFHQKGGVKITSDKLVI